MSLNRILLFGIVCALSFFGISLSERFRVVGGYNASPCEDPHIVALKILYNDTPLLCGGSLLDERHILTAAHCLNFSDQVFANFGSLNLMEMTEEIEVESYELHPDYDLSGETGNDVAVLKLEKPIHFTECIKPIDLAADQETQFINCHISGWGKLSGESNKSSDDLQKAPIEFMPKDDCLEIIPSEQKDQLICLGDQQQNGISACHGDSGGPVTCDHPDTGRPTVVGVASWGARNCDKGISVYAKVSYFKSWIDTMLES